MTIARIGVSQTSLRIVLTSHLWTRQNGQWHDLRAAWFDIGKREAAYRNEFVALAKLLGTGRYVYQLDVWVYEKE